MPQVTADSGLLPTLAWLGALGGEVRWIPIVKYLSEGASDQEEGLGVA